MKEKTFESHINEILDKNTYAFLVESLGDNIFNGIPIIYCYNRNEKIIYLKFVSVNNICSESIDPTNLDFRLIELTNYDQKNNIHYHIIEAKGPIVSVVKNKEIYLANSLFKKKYSEDCINTATSISNELLHANLFKLMVNTLDYKNVPM